MLPSVPLFGELTQVLELAAVGLEAGTFGLDKLDGLFDIHAGHDHIAGGDNRGAARAVTAVDVYFVPTIYHKLDEAGTLLDCLGVGAKPISGGQPEGYFGVAAVEDVLVFGLHVQVDGQAEFGERFPVVEPAADIEVFSYLVVVHGLRFASGVHLLVDYEDSMRGFARLKAGR